MTISPQPEAHWGSSYRLVASERWKAQSAAMGRPLTEALVEYAQPRPGMQVLDLASGTGEPAITIAERIGPTGHVSALDLSADLLEIARHRAQQRGLTNIYFHAGDAHQLPFPDTRFDLATCRFGVMFFHDPLRALREVHRVLKPGARACFAAWGPFDQPYWQTTIGTVARHVGAPVLAPGAQDPFHFAKPGSLSSALQSARFSAIDEETRIVPWLWKGDAEQVWEYAKSVSVPFRALLDRVPPEKWPQINHEVLAAIRQYECADGIDFGAQIVFASGQKSS
jgi:ubiquinone/menaquinone biosynthesis C-methylase UbiE